MRSRIRCTQDESVGEPVAKDRFARRYLLKRYGQTASEATVRKFKTANRDQLMLLPANLNDWVPKNHLARLVLEFVEQLDLTEFYSAYGDEGQPPYDPAMMLAILLYGSCLGITSTRKIERMLTDDVGFRFLAGNHQPDHDTIAAFRKRHANHLRQVFVATVTVAMKAGMVRLNHTAVDGTKVRANANPGRRKSETRIDAEITQAESWVHDYLEACDVQDRQEDEEFGKGKNGYFLPNELNNPESRKKLIKESLTQLKDGSESKNESKSQDRDDDSDSDESGPPTAPAKAKPNAKLKAKLQSLRRAKESLEAQKQAFEDSDNVGRLKRERARKRKGKPYVPSVNVTDPDARTLLFGNGQFNEGYNCQIAVDDDCGIIVATNVTQDANDLNQLAPMVLQIQQTTGWLPDAVTADTGYFSHEQIEDPRLKTVDMYVCPRRAAKKESVESKSEVMREKLETPLGSSLYSSRKYVVEPVFGAIKHARNFRQFAMRGLAMVQAEWILLCTAHNLLKLRVAH